MHACQAVVNFKTLFSICFLLSFSFMITCGWGGGYFTTQVSDDKKQIYNPGKKKCLNGLLFICENCISLTSGQCCEMPKCSTVCQNVGNIEWWGEGKVKTFGYVFVIYQNTIHVISMLLKIIHNEHGTLNKGVPRSIFHDCRCGLFDTPSVHEVILGC